MVDPCEMVHPQFEALDDGKGQELTKRYPQAQTEQVLARLDPCGRPVFVGLSNFSSRMREISREKEGGIFSRMSPTENLPPQHN